MDRLLSRIEHRFGPQGFKKILDALASEENNWALARRFGFSTVEVVWLRNNFALVYATMKRPERRPVLTLLTRSDAA